MNSIWQKVKLEMKKSLPDYSFRMWIQPIKFVGAKQNTIYLTCPNSFSKKRIKENYLESIKEKFFILGKKKIKIELKIEKKEIKKAFHCFAGTRLTPEPATSFVSSQMSFPGMHMRFDSGRMLKKGFTFDDFVVGDNSGFAFSASLSIAEGTNNSNRALYLLSDTGLGKSHLSQAVGHYIMTHGCSEKVYYVTAEDFTNEMIASLKNNSINLFKEKYRKKCDVLILEDVHFLSGKDATQKELAITLDYLVNADKKIIFSGCYLPDDIPKMNEQLKSRLTMGLVTKIDSPDFKTRVRILRKKAKLKGYNLPGDVIDYIAQELCDNVRQLESGLNGVAARGALMGERIDVNLARNVLETISKNKKKITLDFIKKLICNEFSVSEQELISSSRKKRIVKPRQVAMYLARRYTDQPLKEIGRSFNRYHATAIYSINAVEKAIKVQGTFKEQMNYLYKKIDSGKF